MNFQMIFSLFLLLLITLKTGESFSQPSQLDSTFGQKGIVNTSLNVVGNSGSNSVTIQNDGKVIAAGYCSYGVNSDFAIVRYNEDGSLDNSFGTNGIVQTDIENSDNRAYSVAVQNDGKIVVVGFYFNGDDYDLAIVRYNSDGSLDDLFGTSGITITPIGGNSDEVALSMALQNDDKIVVAGSSNNGFDNDIIVARFNPNGFIDNTFGVNGVVTTSIGSSDEKAYSVAIQDDGKIVTGGYTSNGLDNDIAIVRYNPNGTLDNTFGINGIVTTPVGNSYDEIHSIAIQGDGKIIAAGVSNLNDDDFTIIRYDSNGVLDTSFGTNGIVTTPVGDMNDYALAVAIQSEDTGERIVAAGYCMIGSSINFALVSYNNDGSLDSTFGTNGIAITPIGLSESEAYSVAIQPETGKIIAAGFYNDGNREAFALACYNPTGELDDNFGTNGIVTTPVGYSDDLIYSIAIQSDGKIVAAGYSNTGSDINTDRNMDFAVVRYNPDGILDHTFGSGGIVTTEIGSRFDEAFSVAVQNDGKIVTVGSSMDNNGESNGFVVVRYNSNGGLDNTFGTNGIVITPVGSSGGSALSVAIQSDGKIVVAGRSRNENENEFALVRYISDGSLDITFGTNGIVIITNENSDDFFYSLAIVDTGPNAGKIVATGRLGDKIAVARFNPNGTPDFTFGINGSITTSIGSSFEYGNSVTIQDNGKILIATFSHNNDNMIDFAVIRCNSNGILDNTFGVNGVVITPVGSVSVAHSIVIQDEGKIIAAGYSRNGNKYELLIVRYNTDGTLDSTFGLGGIETTQIGSSLSIALAAAIQPAGNGDEKIVVGGYSIGNNSFIFTLARYSLNNLTTSLSDEKLNETLNKFILEQNYPNPFNPITNISYTIPAKEKNYNSSPQLVLLKVYDILGREVATLVNEFMQPGTKTVAFDASGFSSGVYYYKLIIGEFQETKKLIYLK